MMKRISLVLISMILTLPIIAQAAGTHCEGYVNVTEGNPGIMNGAMNVRWSSDAGQISTGTSTSGNEYMEVRGYSGYSAITIRGRDNGGRYFSCSIPSSSKLYDDAKALAYSGGAQNGTRLWVVRGWGTPSTECSHLTVYQNSCYQN